MSMLPSLDAAASRLIEQARSAIKQANAPQRVQGQAPDEFRLIQDAAHGSECRSVLESPLMQTFWAKAEAKLTGEMLALPLQDDGGRRALATSVQTLRSLQKWLLESAQGGRAAERELEKLRNPNKRNFF